MKSGFSRIFPAACLAVFLAARSFAADTNSIASSTNLDATVNGYLQIQMQLHDTQMALEKSRDEARQNAADTTARIAGARRHPRARNAPRNWKRRRQNQQSLFMLAGAFGLTVLAAVLFMAYLQWRSVARLVETASRQGAALASAGAVQQLAAPGRAAVEISNARLLDIVGQLEKKILELESGGRLLSAPPAKPDPLAEGQAFLDANEAQKALECFETVLAAQPLNPEALVKKASALEKLGPRGRGAGLLRPRHRGERRAGHGVSVQGRPAQPAATLRRVAEMLRAGDAGARQQEFMIYDFRLML